MSAQQKHPYHLVEPSCWPILTSFSLLVLVIGSVMFLHEYTGGKLITFSGLLAVICCSFGLLSLVKRATKQPSIDHHA